MKLRVYVRKWRRAERHDGKLQYCECGCGELFPAALIVAVPTGSEDHPFDFIATDHLKQVVGR